MSGPFPALFAQPAPDCCVAFLLRHAATDNNLARPPRLQGRGLDTPLSRAGHEQAMRAGEFLRSWPLAAVYSSPLTRAQQTARAVAEPQKLAVAPVEELIEADVGAWEGRSWGEIAENDADYYRQFQDDPALYGYRDGENVMQVFERVRPALLSLLERHRGQYVAVIGHNVVNRALLAPLLGVSLSDSRAVRQDNAAINVLRYRDGQLKLITLNATFHLEAYDEAYDGQQAAASLTRRR